MQEGLQQLLQRTLPGDGGDGADAAGGRQLTLDFVVGAKASWLQPHLRQYFAGTSGGRGSWRQRTLLVMSLCVWEQTKPFPRQAQWRQEGRVCCLACRACCIGWSWCRTCLLISPADSWHRRCAAAGAGTGMRSWMRCGRRRGRWCC